MFDLQVSNFCDTLISFNENEIIYLTEKQLHLLKLTDAATLGREMSKVAVIDVVAVATGGGVVGGRESGID